MGKLKSYQEQIQDAVNKGLKTLEEQHRALAAKPFNYAEKLEENAKVSVQSIREKHDKALDNVYSTVNTWNKKLADKASELVAKVEKEEAAEEAKAKPAAKKPAAKKPRATAKKATAAA